MGNFNVNDVALGEVYVLENPELYPRGRNKQGAHLYQDVQLTVTYRGTNGFTVMAKSAKTKRTTSYGFTDLDYLVKKPSPFLYSIY